MLRKLIHRVTHIPYAEIRLARTEKGKPYLVNELPENLKKLSFNVSHHGGLTVLAAETQCDIGVDVMKLETPGILQRNSYFTSLLVCSHLLSNVMFVYLWICMDGSLRKRCSFQSPGTDSAPSSVDLDACGRRASSQFPATSIGRLKHKDLFCHVSIHLSVLFVCPTLMCWPV